MTPTSDERREVAEKLRHASHTDANLDVTIAIAILDTIGEVHRPIAAVVADLIDPTCHVSDEEVTHQPTLDAMAVHVYTCDRCSSPFYMGDVCMPPKPLYCPYCGARVVSDDD